MSIQGHKFCCSSYHHIFQMQYLKLAGLVSIWHVIGFSKATMVNYSDYKVYRFTPATDAHVYLLQQLKDARVDFWKGPTTKGVASDVMFAPHQQGDLLNAALNSGMTQEVLFSDVQTFLAKERVGKARTSGAIDWKDYYRLDDIYAYLNKIEAENSYVEVINFGQSYESRDLKVVKISKFCETGEKKPIVFIEANTHAREWISNAVATYIINDLLTGPLKQRLDDFDFHIVPVGNPDGYEFTHTGDRLWRKTRSKIEGSSCIGADPNRNWDYKWMEGGSSGDPCSNTYAGAKPFSEIEIRSLAEYFKMVGESVSFFLGFHSYGQILVMPWGYTEKRIPDYDRYMEVLARGAAALKAIYGTKYKYGSVDDIIRCIYQASGGALDWMLGNYPNIRLVLVAELRDDGKYSFALPPEQIIPTAKEMIAAINVFLDHVKTS